MWCVGGKTAIKLVHPLRKFCRLSRRSTPLHLAYCAVTVDRPAVTQLVTYFFSLLLPACIICEFFAAVSTENLLSFFLSLSLFFLQAFDLINLMNTLLLLVTPLSFATVYVSFWYDCTLNSCFFNCYSYVCRCLL